MLKLDLGAGDVSPDGFVPLGNVNGTRIFPLPYADGTVDEIRASHILEHFPHRQVPEVLKDWARTLKPGGVLRIAVPNFRVIAERYLAGVSQNTEGYVMGGQVDEADFHQAQFDDESLRHQLAAAGLMLIREWRSELTDCAALPISLNLGGTKPHQAEIAVSAVMSVPRLGFMDNFFCAFEALPALRVKLRRYHGAYWEQCIERVIEEAVAEDLPDAILTLDYDSVFTRRDAAMLMQLMCCHPEVDALAAVQAGRSKDLPLFTVRATNGHNAEQVPAASFAPDLAPVSTAHFGLTLLRTEKLRVLPKPWFRSQPADDGGWGDGHVDADIAFWRRWDEAGNSLFLANRVPIGHLELMVKWPGPDLRVVHQDIGDWRKTGTPEGIWQ
jgi:hypothetical protein